MTTPSHYIALFENARAVICTEAACRGANIPVRVIPPPKDISSMCGMCLVFEAGKLDDFRKVEADLELVIRVEPFEY